MLLDSAGLTNAIFLMLSIILVALAASMTMRFNKRFTRGEVKDLGHYVSSSMLCLLGKFLTDFSILILPSFMANPAPLIQLLGIFEIIFVLLAAVFMIKVAIMIKSLSKTFGFELK